MKIHYIFKQVNIRDRSKQVSQSTVYSAVTGIQCCNSEQFKAIRDTETSAVSVPPHVVSSRERALEPSSCQHTNTRRTDSEVYSAVYSAVTSDRVLFPVCDSVQCCGATGAVSAPPPLPSQSPSTQGKVFPWEIHPKLHPRPLPTQRD